MMSDFENILLEIDGGVATITFNRPKVLNALSVATLKELSQALDEVAANDDARAVVITGAGEKAFIAGADINELAVLGATDGQQVARHGQFVMDKIEGLGKPVIAAINGFALGGGCELALACHLRLASDAAKIGLPEINLGVLPGHGGTQRLARLIGKGRALDLICTGRHIGAAEAKEMGLVNEVIPHDELMDRVRELAETLASKAPVAMRYCLEAVNQGLETTLSEGLIIESNLFGLVCATDDQKEGMGAFLGKRKPEWKGR
jgi:enoyl-CoA hydratase